MYYIYKIENLVNHKKYIGLTNNIARRRSRHFTDLKCHRHDNSFLQKEYDLYGAENFSFEKIFEGDVTPEEIGIKEQEYIKKYDSYYNGYNQNEGGNFGPTNGGSHLTQSDIYNILAATEFMNRPGTILGKMFEVSNTTIMRIKKGVNHCQHYEKYWQLSEEERRDIFNIFCESNNLLHELEVSHRNDGRRKLTVEQAILALTNAEEHFYPKAVLSRKLGVTDNVLTGIEKG